MVDPNRNPSATRIASSDRGRPTAVIGGELSQSPVCGVATAMILVLSAGVSQMDSRTLYAAFTIDVSNTPCPLDVSDGVAWLIFSC